MGPKCPVCKRSVGLKDLAPDYRVAGGRRCRSCGQLFRLHANEATFASVAAIVFFAFIAGAIMLALVGLGGGSGVVISRVLVGGVMILGALVGLWLGLKAKPLSQGEERCIGCGHDITNWPGEQCPECGFDLELVDPETTENQRAETRRGP